MTGIAVWTLLQFGKKAPDWRIVLSESEKKRLFLICILTEGTIVAEWLFHREASIGALLCLEGFAGCLLAACVMDMKEQMVYRFVWAAAGIVIFVYEMIGVWEGGNLITADFLLSSGMEYLIFVGLQQGLFARFYGRADCHAFSVCGAFWLTKGEVFDRCVVHMAVSFILLAVMQLFRGNIAPKGRLKRPVAMVPYIVVGFGICRAIAKS